MGRPRKPSHLHVVEGTTRPDRTNPKEPKPKAKRPKVPAHLSPKAKTAFKNVCDLLEDMGVLTIADGLALELMCDAYAEWRDLTKLIEKEGRTYKITSTTGEEVIKAHPAVAMRSDAWKRIKSMMAEFGMTAATRSKVSIIEPEAQDQLEAYLNRGKGRPPKDPS